MRRLLAALLLALGALAAAQDAIVFIRPERAGPQIPREIDPHPIWVQWGPKADANGLNRLLEPVTGLTWDARTTDFRFHVGPKGPHLDASSAWQTRGIFRARENVLGPSVALRPARPSTYPQGVTPLAARPDGNFLGEGDVILAEADGWDDVARLSKTRRRTAVLEYPPDEQGLGHLWLFGGEAWPVGVPKVDHIPGLLPATSVGRILRDPGAASWIEKPRPSVSALAWAQAKSGSFGCLRLGIGLCYVVAFLVGVRAVATESNGSRARTTLEASLFAPYSAFLASYFARAVLGPEATLPLVLVATASCAFVLPPIRRHSRFGPPWTPLAVGGLFACWFEARDWNVFSSMPGIEIGLLAVLVAATLAALPEPPSIWTWAGRLLPFFLVLVTAEGEDFRYLAGCVFLAVASLVCAEGWLAGRRGLLWLLLIVGWIAGLFREPVFAWEGLLTTFSQAGKPNLYGLFEALLHPLTLTTVFGGLLLAIFAPDYLRHRLRRALGRYPRLNGIWQFAGLSCAVFTLEPALSLAPPVILAGAAGATLLAALEG